ncbi:PREDICTED: cytochrome P450 705A20-like [Tarenaya hassleriana]|uniref:cytochrome P450 705A20-like n=1 Tax=Tarenaya hassleriana TaxID=28532 RepID=UPI00053C2593|nr:PREDICTED: cytochrome P450 705A20-like [Tarenaya hassleriana]
MMVASSIFELQYISMFVLIWLISVLIFFTLFFKKPKESFRPVRLPPSPPSLPIIGHLHLLPYIASHKSLQKLSSRHGPILSIHAFKMPIVVVSSASVAYDVYRTQDVNFSSRHPFAIENSIVFGPYGFITAPYGDYWRFMKKMVMAEMLGQLHLERSRHLRGEELKKFCVNLLDKAKRDEPIRVSEEMMKLTSNNIWRMTVGNRFSEEGGRVRELVSRSLDMSKKLIIENALRPLRRFGISFCENQILDISRRFDELLEKYLRDHEENPNREDKDMMDIVLEAYHDENAEYKISRNQIKAFLVELFIGGTDTSAQATQWTMGELINHPNIFKKLREEIDSVVGKTRLVQETDLPKLPYLQAVVKEGLRLHPPANLSIRRCGKPCKVSGYDVPENTMLVVNSYAIMRDPSSWGQDSDQFRPERFLESPKGIEGSREEGLKYLAFGSGRRACPGSNLAYLFLDTAIGAMVQCFDWKMDAEKVDMEEVEGITLTMAHPFSTTPVVRPELIPLLASSSSSTEQYRMNDQ